MVGEKMAVLHPIFLERDLEVFSNGEREGGGLLKNHADSTTQMEDIRGGRKDIGIPETQRTSQATMRNQISESIHAGKKTRLPTSRWTH